MRLWRQKPKRPASQLYFPVRECPFAAFLPEGEIWVGGEILIQHHVVVEILHAEDRREGDVAELVFYRETVDKRPSAVVACVVIGDPAFGEILIGITVLTCACGHRHIFHHYICGGAECRLPA